MLVKLCIEHQVYDSNMHHILRDADTSFTAQQVHALHTDRGQQHGKAVSYQDACNRAPESDEAMV